MYEEEREETRRERRKRQRTQVSVSRIGVEVGESAYTRDGSYLGRVSRVMGDNVIVANEVEKDGKPVTFTEKHAIANLWWG